MTNARVTDATVKSGNSPFSRWVISSAGVILTITGAAKVWSFTGNSKLLSVNDPIFGLKFGQLMLAVGFLEIIVALVCVSSKRQSLATILVAWLATNFVLYRLGLWWVHWHSPCPCLGNLTDALHIPPRIADDTMKIVLAYLLIASYILLIRQWRRNQKAA